MFAGQTFHHLSPSPTSWALSILFGHLQAGLEAPEESEEAVSAGGMWICAYLFFYIEQGPLEQRFLSLPKADPFNTAPMFC